MTAWHNSLGQLPGKQKVGYKNPGRVAANLSSKLKFRCTVLPWV